MRSGTDPVIIADGYLRVSSFLHLEEIRESITDSYRQLVATEGRKAWPRLKEILEQHGKTGS